MLSKEKCEKAIDNVARYCSDYKLCMIPPRFELTNELEVLMDLIKEHFELVEKFNEMERTMHSLECKLTDVYYPRAYEFKELKKGMWVWYKPFKECKKIRELSDNDEKFKWVEFEDGFVIKYEDCQFFSITKTLEY